MKKTVLKSISVLMAVILFVTQSQSLAAKPLDTGLPGVDESVFILDQASLNEALQDLNKLDSYLDQNEGITYADLAISNSDLIKNVSDNSAPMGMSAPKDDLLGIPPFLWGCILGWVGLLLVYILTDGDKPSVKKALIGALVTTGVLLVVYIVAWSSLFASSSTHYY